jgi:hypothetical protein
MSLVRFRTCVNGQRVVASQIQLNYRHWRLFRCNRGWTKLGSFTDWAGCHMALRAVAYEQAMSDPINEALVLYTGFGSSPFPRAKTPHLMQRFGEAEGAELKQRILGLLEELQQPVDGLEKRSKKSLTERAIEQLQPRHPELDDAGLKALAWTYSFGLR